MTEQLWGGETTKAVDNFPVSGERVPAPVVRELGRLKAAAARVNGELGGLDADLAERIANAPNLEFRGLQAYHGEAQHLVGHAVRKQAIQEAIEIVRASVAALAERGLPCALVSGAGTGTFPFEAASGVYNELQVGSYVFMDREYADVGGQDGGLYSEFEHSLFVLATVISTPAPDRAVRPGV